MARGFRNIIFGASVYVDGESYLGEAASVTLPDLQAIVDDQRNMGMPGPVARFSGYERPQVEMEFNGYFNPVMAQWGNPDIRAYNYTVRWATRDNDGEVKSGVAEFAGRASGRTQAAMGNGEDVSTTTLTIECVAYKEEYDGTTNYDIDIEAGKVEVDGTDHWSAIADAL